MEDQEIKVQQTLPDIRTLVVVDDMVSAVTSAILSGEIEPVKAGVILKKMGKVAEEVLKNEAVKLTILEDTERYLEGNNKSCKVYGATLTRAAVWTGYDFSMCKDPILTALYEIQEQVKAHIKNKEEELKLLINTNNKDITPNTGEPVELRIKNTGKPIIIEAIPTLVWENSGEVVNVYPPHKRQTMGIKYSKL